MRAGWYSIVIFTLVAIFAGCAESPSGPTIGPPVLEESEPVAAQPAGLKPADIKLVTGDEKKLAELIAAHKGQVVFVDYWATWCEPCVEYFPHTVEMHKAHHKDGLRTIGVTFDDPADETVVREFLASHGADFENLVSSYPQGSEAFEGFKLDLVPTFRLYDRKGVERYKWEKKPEDADEKIAELLAEAAE
jgi:thiol-disulfide isomerase/thioredoxin